MNLHNPFLSIKNVRKVFEQSGKKLEILKGIDLDIKKGEALCIMGASGAGKSTLLQIMGTLDRPTSGQILFENIQLQNLSDEKLSEFRNKKMGFIFQFHHLLPEFTALENVCMPAWIAGVSNAEAKSKALKLLSLMGLKERHNHYPNELSGGEQQRVAIARALVMSPEILFADEPTGNLDSDNAYKIQNLLFEIREKMNIALVVVSHDSDFARKFPRTLHMRDGQWINA